MLFVDVELCLPHWYLADLCVKPENGIQLSPILTPPKWRGYYLSHRNLINLGKYDVWWCFWDPLLAEAVYTTLYHEFNMQIHIIMVNGD